MNNIFRYVVFAGGFYISINWLADNPKRVDIIRDQVNNFVQALF